MFIFYGLWNISNVKWKMQPTNPPIRKSPITWGHEIPWLKPSGKESLYKSRWPPILKMLTLRVLYALFSSPYSSTLSPVPCFITRFTRKTPEIAFAAREGSESRRGARENNFSSRTSSPKLERPNSTFFFALISEAASWRTTLLRATHMKTYLETK